MWQINVMYTKFANLLTKEECSRIMFYEKETKTEAKK